MPIKISEYIDVKKQALRLGCNVPTDLALLPINFAAANDKEEFIYEDTVLTIRKLWRQAGLIESKLEKEGDKIPYEQRKSFEWVAPTIFVSASLLSQQPDIVSIALNIISTYLTDFFKGIVGDKTIKLDIVVEQEGQKKSKRIHYEGNVEGLAQLTEAIKEVRDL